MYKLITALILMAPAASWAQEAVPEPEVLSLLAVGGVIAVAVKFMRKR